MESEIRTCFSLFANHLKNTIKNLPEYNYDELSIQQMKAESDILYMKYILNSSYLNSEKSIVTSAYKHLKKMIKDNKSDNDCKLLTLENFLLKQELNQFKNVHSNVISDQTTQTKGWFFS